MPISFDRLIDQQAFDWLKEYSVEAWFEEEPTGRNTPPAYGQAAVFKAPKKTPALPIVRAVQRRMRRLAMRLSRRRLAFAQPQ